MCRNRLCQGKYPMEMRERGGEKEEEEEEEEEDQQDN